MLCHKKMLGVFSLLLGERVGKLEGELFAFSFIPRLCQAERIMHGLCKWEEEYNGCHMKQSIGPTVYCHCND